MRSKTTPAVDRWAQRKRDELAAELRIPAALDAIEAELKKHCHTVKRNPRILGSFEVDGIGVAIDVRVEQGLLVVNSPVRLRCLVRRGCGLRPFQFPEGRKGFSYEKIVLAVEQVVQGVKDSRAAYKRDQETYEAACTRFEQLRKRLGKDAPIRIRKRTFESGRSEYPIILEFDSALSPSDEQIEAVVKAAKAVGLV